MKSFERFAAVLECPTEETWQDSIFHLGNDFGFEHALIAVVPDRQTPLETAFLRSNYSRQWRSIYDSMNMVNIDPTVTHCVMRSTPLEWEPKIFSSKQQKEMYEEASEHGLRSGITLPFHGANGELGILCLVNNVKPGKAFQQDTRHHISELSMMRDFVFEASLRFAKPIQNNLPPTLTKRELECLKWCAAGKSSWEIAKILCCSEATVNFHFGNLRHKFNATSRRQVMVKAIRFGLLTCI